MLTPKRLLILIPLILVSACTFQLLREMRGPVASTAYRWVFDEPVPEYVTALKSEYYSHLKGYGLYLGFVVPPSRLNEVVDIESSIPLYPPDSDYIEPWHQEDRFRDMFPDNPPDVQSCRKTDRTIEGESWSVVYNPSTGNV